MMRPPSAKRSLAAALLLASLLALTLSGCGRAIDVTAKPTEAVDQQVAESQPAPIYVAAPADFTRLEDEIAKALPSDLPIVPRRISHAVCTGVGNKQTCQDARLTGRLVRDGAVRAAGSAHGIEVTVPLRYELAAQGFGTGNTTAVEGKLAVTASFAFSLDEHWQAALKLNPVYRWEDGAKIKILAGDTTVQPDVEPQLTQRLSKLPPTAVAGLVQTELRAQVEIAWRYLHYPMALSQEQQIWLRGTPLGLRFAGLVTHDGATDLRMAIATRLQTFVGDRPAPLPPSPMPAPGGGPDGATGGILLPAEVSYAALGEATSHHLPAIPVLGAADTSSAEPVVKSFTFFPAGKRLALAVSLGSLPGSSWLSGPGVAYFLATPALKPGTSKLVLNQVELFSGGAKAPSIQRELPFLADSRFADNVGSAVQFDVADKLVAATDLVKRQASVPLVQGLKLSLSPTGARITKFIPGLDALRLQIEVIGDLTVRREGTDVAADNAGQVKATP